MQLFQTTRGVARRRGPVLELLGGLDDLPALLATGSLGSVAEAGVVDEIALPDAVLLAPVRPGRLFQVGLNYASHLAEVGLTAPDRPIFAVADAADSVSGPDAVVLLPPDHPDHVDHECEVAVVIGAPAAGVTAASAWSVIAGVTAADDVTARDVQRDGLAAGDRVAGKMLPGFTPLGPGLLTADEAAAGPLLMRLTVNGETRQETDTAEMVFGIPELVAAVSAERPLVPGDVILTGSPAGAGFTTGRYLRPGDVVEITLGPLPPLRTTFEKG